MHATPLQIPTNSILLLKMTDTPDILKKILDRKAEEIANRKQRTTVDLLKEMAGDAETPRGFASALQSKANSKNPAIITEIKKASPSKGVIREHFKPL